MKEFVILNGISVTAGAAAIAVACMVTKSVLPLFAFILVPKWSYRGNDSEEKEK